MEQTSLNSTEVCIKDVWSKILNVAIIEPDQSFFELGGDSLLMIDMLFQVSKAVEVEIDPSLLFEDASLRGFSRLVDAARSGA